MTFTNKVMSMGMPQVRKFSHLMFFLKHFFCALLITKKSKTCLHIFTCFPQSKMIATFIPILFEKPWLTLPAYALIKWGRLSIQKPKIRPFSKDIFVTPPPKKCCKYLSKNKRLYFPCKMKMNKWISISHSK